MVIAGKDLQAFLSMEFHVPVPPGGQYIYYPGTSEVPERSAANVHAVSYKVLAEIEVDGDAQGVLLAQASRFGAHSLFIKDGTLTYAYNFLGIPPETRFSAPAPRSGRHIVGVDFAKQRMDEHRESYGPLKLYPEARSSRSCSTSPTTPTSRPTWPPPWPGTEPGQGLEERRQLAHSAHASAAGPGWPAAVQAPARSSSRSPRRCRSPAGPARSRAARAWR
jgi:hypothetical protein